MDSKPIWSRRKHTYSWLWSKHEDDFIRNHYAQRRLIFINGHSRIRAQRLWCLYRLQYYDAIWLYEIQSGKCLWCGARLPDDPLSCWVDHIGGKRGWRNRDNVRGLCCPDGVCNTLAGRIEKELIQKEDWGTLTAVVEQIKCVLRTNHGHLPFPRNVGGTWITKPQLKAA